MLDVNSGCMYIRSNDVSESIKNWKKGSDLAALLLSLLTRGIINRKNEKKLIYSVLFNISNQLSFTNLISFIIENI